MKVTLAYSSFIDCSTAVPLYLKLYGYLQLCSSGVSKMVHIGCRVLCHILPNLTIYVGLGMDWLHTIKPHIDRYAYSLSVDCESHTLSILGI